MVGGMQAAMVQSLSPSRMRGMMAALYGAVVTIAGLGIAPTVTALLSDHVFGGPMGIGKALRSEEHTSELQSLMRNSYAVSCLTKKKLTRQSNVLICPTNQYNKY